MELTVGEVLEGKVTGITKFGAFVLLPGGKSGLVHISEVANAFVSDVHDHVQIGQPVKVKVLSVSEEGKINLSMKRVQEAEPQARPAGEFRPRRAESAPRAEARGSEPVPQAQPLSRYRPSGMPAVENTAMWLSSLQLQGMSYSWPSRLLWFRL